MDLLTTLTHEFGHVLGLEHTDDGLMAPVLGPGVRFIAQTGNVPLSQVLLTSEPVTARFGGFDIGAQEPIGRREIANVDAGALAARHNGDVSMAALPGRRAGGAAFNVTMPATHDAGHGRFIGLTPLDNAERSLRVNGGKFQGVAGDTAYGKNDLLITLTYDSGHVPGFLFDTDDRPTACILAPDVIRRRPYPNDVLLGPLVDVLEFPPYTQG
jgi:hypothetical protein